MATINTLQDLNQALRDNPEWREEIRRTLLSAELLALPDTQASLAAEVREFVAATNRRFSIIEWDIVEIRKIIEELRRDIRAIHGITQRQQSDFQNFRGQFAENTTRKKAPSITMAVGNAIGKRLLNKRVLTQADLSTFTQNADASRIPYNHIISFQEADLIIEAYNLQDRDDTCFIAVEASYTCGQDDTDRALRHAAILRGFTGKPVYPVVSGVRIHDALKASVNGGSEDAILWHKIDEEELDV